MKTAEELFEEWCKGYHIPYTYKEGFKEAFLAGYKCREDKG